MDNSKNHETRPFRCDLAIQQCEEIVERYESRNIAVLNTSASEVAKGLKRARKELLNEVVTNILGTARRRAESAATITSKVNVVTEASGGWLS